MAGDIEKNIKIKYSNTGLTELTRQTENYSRSLKTITTTNQTLNQQTGHWNTTSQSIRSTQGAFSGLKSQLTSTMMSYIGLNAVISMGKQGYEELRKWIDNSVASYRAFEYQIAEVSSILDSTTRETLPAMEVGISSLSVKYGKSVGDMTKGLYDIVSAAFDAKDAMGLLDVVTKAAIAGVTTVTSAVETITGVLNAYGLSAAHAAEVSDVLFQAVIRGVFTFKELESSLGYVTPIAANLGVSLEEVTAAMSTATRQGQHIDSVTRGLGLLMQGIVNPTEQASEAAKQYGIDMSATGLRIGGLTEFFNQLSVATKKYGMQILPELIGNMRSLRVAMALTSEAGIKGFVDDMGLMETATGRTDAALASMMNTQQMMADILTQSMEKVNRSIGEAWSGVDIWWKKAQLWWGTLLSGGDADKAVKGFDSAVEAMRQAYIKNIIQTATSGEKTIFDKIQEIKIPSSVNSVFTGLIKSAIQFETVKKYLDLSDQIESMNKASTAITNARMAIDSLHQQGVTKGVGGINMDTLKVANDALASLGLRTFSLTEDNGKLADYYAALDNKMVEVNGTLESLINTESELRPVVDQVKTAFEDMDSEISTHKENIITLESELKKLNTELNTIYKGFSGTLEFGIAVKVMENAQDQFQESANMAMKYGEQYINEYTDVFDQYGNSMKSVINTIYEYNDALAAEKKAQDDAKNSAHELEIQMASNNLQMLKLQLMGMMRRRGNTRAEQREMKQIEIENTKLRIQQMQTEYDASISGDEAMIDAKQSAYEEAQNILSAYTDYEKHQLWMLKDTRSEDIQSLRDNLASEKIIYEQKKTQLATEYKALQDMTTRYTQSLLAVSSDPSLASAYKELFGIDAMEEAISTYGDYLDFVKANPLPNGVGGITGVGTGGNDGTVPMYSVLSKTNLGVRNGMPTYGTVVSSSGVSKGYDTLLGENPELAKLKTGDTIGWQRGTNYIPETGMYQLHRGESVSSAGNNNDDNGVSIGNINITVPVRTDASPKEIASAIKEALNSQILKYDSTGKLISKYRRR